MCGGHFRTNHWDRRSWHRCNAGLRGNRPVLHAFPPASQPFRRGINWLIRAKFLRFSGKSCFIAARLRPFQTISFLSLHASFPSLFIWWKENSDCFSSTHKVSIATLGTKVKAKNSLSCHIYAISFVVNVLSSADRTVDLRVAFPQVFSLWRKNHVRLSLRTNPKIGIFLQVRGCSPTANGIGFIQRCQ